MKGYRVQVFDDCGAQSWPIYRSTDDVLAKGPSQAAAYSCECAIAARREVDHCRVQCPDGSVHTFDVTSVRVSCSVKWRRQ